ncbi:hypothetical protein D3C87_2173670 [compost metagenome]
MYDRSTLGVRMTANPYAHAVWFNEIRETPSTRLDLFANLQGRLKKMDGGSLCVRAVLDSRYRVGRNACFFS